MSARIRFATPDDAATIFEFIRQLAVYEREPDQVQTTARRLREQLESPSPPFQCLLVEEHGAAVGFALFFLNYSTWRGSQGLYLEDLFVKPEARGKGYGKSLLMRLARIAVERGYARFEWAALNWNTPAIEFYKAAGAVALDDWTTFRLTGEALHVLARGKHGAPESND
jgi:GNAT superfamily N-acetyltransferase